MIEKVLTKKNLAILGVYDEFIDLYDRVVEIYDRELTNHHLDGIVTLEQCILVKRNTEERVRCALDHVRMSIGRIYTDDYQNLRMNRQVVKLFNLIETKEQKPRKAIPVYTWRYKTFDKFVEDITTCIIACVYYNNLPHKGKRIDLEDLNNCFPQIEKTVFEYINNLLVERNKTIIKTYNKHSGIEIQKATLWVFSNLHTISCNRKSHHVIPSTRNVNLTNNNAVVYLPVHKCTSCGKTFIGFETLKIYERLYGKTSTYLISDYNNKKFDKDSFEWSKLGESELHKKGYNVKADGMSEQERRELLSSLINSKQMTVFQICRDIESAIKIFDGRDNYKLAVAKWKRDLKFVNELEIEDE